MYGAPEARRTVERCGCQGIGTATKPLVGDPEVGVMVTVTM